MRDPSRIVRRDSSPRMVEAGFAVYAPVGLSPETMIVIFTPAAARRARASNSRTSKCGSPPTAAPGVANSIICCEMMISSRARSTRVRRAVSLGLLPSQEGSPFIGFGNPLNAEACRSAGLTD